MSKADTSFCNRDGGFGIAKYEGLKVDRRREAETACVDGQLSGVSLWLRRMPFGWAGEHSIGGLESRLRTEAWKLRTGGQGTEQQYNGQSR